MYSFWESDLGTIICILIFIFVMAGIIVGIIAIANHVNFPVDLAKIEQLRKDAQDIDIRGSEGIYSLVCICNQRIASKQKMNSMWWSDLFVSDRWDDVEFIQLPKER